MLIKTQYLTIIWTMMMTKKSTEPDLFTPGASSTPYYGAEQYEMGTMMHEQIGLPDDLYEETPF